MKKARPSEIKRFRVRIEHAVDALRHAHANVKRELLKAEKALPKRLFDDLISQLRVVAIWSEGQ